MQWLLWLNCDWCHRVIPIIKINWTMIQITHFFLGYSKLLINPRIDEKLERVFNFFPTPQNPQRQFFSVKSQRKMKISQCPIFQCVGIVADPPFNYEILMNTCRAHRIDYLINLKHIFFFRFRATVRTSRYYRRTKHENRGRGLGNMKS